MEPPDLSHTLERERLVDLLLNAELLEQRRLLGVELDAADQRGLEAVEEAHNALVLGLGVDPDGGEVVGDLVAQDALDEVEVVIDQRRRFELSARCLMSAHRLSRKRMSARSSSSLAPWRRRCGR